MHKSIIMFGTDPLVVLFLCYLLHLIEKLPHTKLQLGEFVLGGDLRVVICALTDTQVQMNSLQKQWITKLLNIYTSFNF